ncbi:MAG: hypothetical protein KDN22_10940 [Verrucomicrobiae bacterium]|nr:hypothetical protein [Verrucomicrobiae bacterium]
MNPIIDRFFSEIGSDGIEEDACHIDIWLAIPAQEEWEDCKAQTQRGENMRFLLESKFDPRKEVFPPPIAISDVIQRSRDPPVSVFYVPLSGREAILCKNARPTAWTIQRWR